MARSVTWRKSAIGYKQDQKRTIRELGLRRLGQTSSTRTRPRSAAWSTRSATSSTCAKEDRMRSAAARTAPPTGATHPAKRVGRGNGSGHGTYSGKGLKGQKSRSGKKAPYDAFEGGQFPSSRKFHSLRGFNNKWRVSYQPVNLGALRSFRGGRDDDATRRCVQAGILKHLREPVKVLGRWRRHQAVHRFRPPLQRGREEPRSKPPAAPPLLIAAR